MNLVPGTYLKPSSYKRKRGTISSDFSAGSHNHEFIKNGIDNSTLHKNSADTQSTCQRGRTHFQLSKMGYLS
jgi:hypothetical protein